MDRFWLSFFPVFCIFAGVQLTVLFVHLFFQLKVLQVTKDREREIKKIQRGEREIMRGLEIVDGRLQEIQEIIDREK